MDRIQPNDVKSVETQLEEYATKTLEDVSSYFLQLHSFLQNEEKKILELFHARSEQPQLQLRQVFAKLTESHETLNTMRTALHILKEKPQNNIHLGQVLEKCNQQLEQLPCQLHVVKPICNPFHFEVKEDFYCVVEKCFEHEFKDPQIRISISALKDDSNQTLTDTSSIHSSMVSNSNALSFTVNNKQPRKLQRQCISISPNIPQETPNHCLPHANCYKGDVDEMTDNAENLVRVTYVKSPDHFYIQKVKRLQEIRELSKAYLDHAQGQHIPRIISVGYYYMTFHAKDKQWYRGIVKKILPNELYKVFLVDFGMHLELSREMLCDIDQTHLNIPFAAMRCALYDILPAGAQWNQAAHDFMIELLNNNPAQMTIYERTSTEMLKIDLETSRTNSVRGSFLYVGLARERHCIINFKMKLKTISSKINISERIPKSHIEAGEVVMVSMLNVEGPQKFYVLKSDEIDEKRNFARSLNMHYSCEENNHTQIYLGSAHMCCAVCIDHNWHRATIEKVMDRGNLLVYLVDEGRLEEITWRQAFVLQDEFRRRNEYAICCSLADVEPLQDNSYTYTSTAINDFKRMTVNPCLHMEVLGYKELTYSVVLCVSKKNIVTNIAAVLVKNKHGISTGMSSQTIEVAKMNRKLITGNKPENLMEVQKSSLLNPSLMSPSSSVHGNDFSKSQSTSTSAVQRTPVTVVHIVSPGEFYIQLSKLKHGTKAFHLQIQETQTRKLSTMENSSENNHWSIGDHCLVYTTHESYPTLMGSTRGCEWYRGIINCIAFNHNEESTYSVFLRDVGATIKSPKYQIFPIDHQLDRVTNAVYCCHLAAIEPTGGQTWSHSAIDWFRHSVNPSESLSVSMYGKRSVDTLSIPVILWSSLTETTDPLAPCITKYSNINRWLVNSGLAYMAERLDIAQQFDRIDEMELSEGEITMEQWFRLFQDITSNVQHPRHLGDFTMDESCEVENSEASEDHPLSIHLKQFDMKPTTGQIKPPPMWETSKDVKKTLFTGYPTYVDYNCVVYLHEAEDRPLLDAMSSIISKQHIELPQPDSDYKYSTGQPVIARYNGDNKFYRAVMRSDKFNDEGELEVFFIDYGNVESIKPEDIRPYAPFPNLPSIANKYIVIGIQPKDGKDAFVQEDLDQMHLLIVGQLVSVRLSPSELAMPIKLCSMRLGTADVASTFIENKLAEKADMRKHLPLPAAQSVSSNLNKGRNAIDEVFSGNIDSNIRLQDDKHFADNKKIDSTLENIAEYDHINNFIDQIYQNSEASQKRMFNDDDYSQLVNGVTAFNSDGLKSQCVEYKSWDYSDENDDIVELSHRFTLNHWHKADMDVGDEVSLDIVQQLDCKTSEDVEDIVSEFEKFQPNDTSTVLSHISGIDLFRIPQWPLGFKKFYSRVVSIVTPTIVQIFPNHLEFQQREVELQRDIRHKVKTASPLKNFDVGTVCLACFSKDNKWYRAIVRSHNKIANTIDVFYVDYLNSETLPTKCVRECPPGVLRWPLLTFRVCLHGVKPNPQIRDRDIRLALRKQLIGQNLYTVVKKTTNNKLSFSDTQQIRSIFKGEPVCSNCNNLMHISLYKTQELSLRGITAYDALIECSFLLRT